MIGPLEKLYIQSSIASRKDVRAIWFASFCGEFILTERNLIFAMDTANFSLCSCQQSRPSDTATDFDCCLPKTLSKNLASTFSSPSESSAKSTVAADCNSNFAHLEIDWNSHPSPSENERSRDSKASQESSTVDSNSAILSATVKCMS